MMNAYKELRVADIDIVKVGDTVFNTYQLTGAQLFIKNMFNPNTLYRSILVNWQTGVGKSIAAIAIGNEFIKQYQIRFNLGEKIPKMVCILGFTIADTIQSDLIKYPELGYATKQEIEELHKLSITDDPRHSQYLAMLHKRLSSKALGGYYKFYGYREFVNHLFTVTNKGLTNDINILSIFDTKADTNIEYIQELIDNEYILLNEDLVNKLKNGIIIADEIHNVYNSVESNNYGLVIKYILHRLKNEAPRTVYMSATPITGNASEVIDLLNILNPTLSLRRTDYFFKDDEGIYQLKPHTLQEITKLSKGKVSYLLDTNKDLYPRRIFLGEIIQEIPYIKLNICNIPSYYQNAINHELNINKAIGLSVYTLYDIVFPNPYSTEYGLYSNVIDVLLNSKQEWRREAGIDVYRNSDNATVITGSFLYKDNLKKYSMKYYNVLMDILDAIKNKIQGKIMIYHHKVQVSGVLLLQEIFKLNGFIDETSEPNNSTLCVICGVTYIDHNDNNHIYKPCRFIVAHGTLNKRNMVRNIAKYNDISNLYGTEYKLLIGSRVLKEGHSLFAVRWQYIMSLPINFPMLIQVLGRVVRKNSHSKLPEDERIVYVKIYANEIELSRYKIKAKEYYVIQQVERALRINAVDNFINYKNTTTEVDTLESLRFIPTNIEKPPIISAYFDAYGYNTEEIILIKKLIFLLFVDQPVWTYDDLWDNIHKIVNVNYNLNLIDKGNFDIALFESKEISNINNKYYIKGSAKPDVDYYFRDQVDTDIVSINLTSYFTTIIENENLIRYMNEYLTKYIDDIIELSLIDLPYEFHINILKKIVLKQRITNNDKPIINLYKRFKILITVDNKNIGYVDLLSVVLYNELSDKWYDAPLNSYSIGTRFIENDIIVGYAENGKFKIRDPIKNVKIVDLRAFKKGAVCTTYSRKDILTILNKLRSEVTKGYAYIYDKKINKPTMNDLCNILKLYLLYTEEMSRSTSDGMKTGTRWLYLFNDQMPNIIV